jgi:hypothetical protein
MEGPVLLQLRHNGDGSKTHQKFSGILRTVIDGSSPQIQLSEHF